MKKECIDNGERTRFYEVKEDCFCEHYLHEISHYPREGLKEKRLNKGDVVEYQEKYVNCYGVYFRVNKDKETYDIPPQKLEQIKA